MVCVMRAAAAALVYACAACSASPAFAGEACLTVPRALAEVPRARLVAAPSAVGGYLEIITAATRRSLAAESLVVAEYPDGSALVLMVLGGCIRAAAPVPSAAWPAIRLAIEGRRRTA